MRDVRTRVLDSLLLTKLALRWQLGRRAWLAPALALAWPAYQAFSLLVGWLAKVLILRFGGARFFQAGRNIFIGMIFGEALAAGVWLVINLILASNGYTNYQPLRFLPG